MLRANYTIEKQTPDLIIIRDVGPWCHYATVTNAAESVVEELGGVLKGRKLFYYDSANQLDQILVKNNVFAGFAPAPRNINGGR